jgi:transposase
MEDAILYEIFGVSRDYQATTTEVKHGGVFVGLEPRARRYVCPKCRSRDVIRRGKRVRRVQTLPIGFHPVYLEVEVPRCQCNRCEHLFEIAPPFAPPTRITPKR